MKKIQLPIATLASIFFILVGCTKDPVIVSDHNTNRVHFKNTLPVSVEPAKIFGMISGVILPTDAKGEIRLYRDVNSFEVFYPNRDGSFKKEFVAQGFYRLCVYPGNPIYMDAERYLFVTNGEATIVKIILQRR